MGPEPGCRWKGTGRKGARTPGGVRWCAAREPAVPGGMPGPGSQGQPAASFAFRISQMVPPLVRGAQQPNSPPDQGAVLGSPRDRGDPAG